MKKFYLESSTAQHNILQQNINLVGEPSLVDPLSWKLKFLLNSSFANDLVLTKGDFSECSDSESCSELTERPLKKIWIESCIVLVKTFLDETTLDTGRWKWKQCQLFNLLTLWIRETSFFTEVWRVQKNKLLWQSCVICFWLHNNTFDLCILKLSLFKNEVFWGIYLNKCLLLAAESVRVSNSFWDCVRRTCLPRFFLRKEDLEHHRKHIVSFDCVWEKLHGQVRFWIFRKITKISRKLVWFFLLLWSEKEH